MDLLAWLERSPADWPGMIEGGVGLPSSAEVAAALEPWLEGPRCGNEEFIVALLKAFEEADPESAWWLRLMRVFQVALGDVDFLQRSATCRQRPDFQERRARLACTTIGAAFILGRQQVDEALADRFDGTAATMARTFIEAEAPGGGG